MKILEAAIEKEGGVRALARKLKVSPQALSNMRKDGSRPVSPHVAAGCAEVMGIDPEPAILEALMMQANVPVQQESWAHRIKNWAALNPSSAAVYAPLATIQRNDLPWKRAAAACLVVAFSTAAAFNAERQDENTVLRTKGSEVRILPGAPLAVLGEAVLPPTKKPPPGGFLLSAARPGRGRA